MIKRIFQDIDECILHTFVNFDPNQNHVEFVLGEDMHIYRTIIRPCAKELFEYYNSVVGKENVYILTTATREYAETLNRLGQFGLDNDHIFAREDLKNAVSDVSYITLPHPTLAHPNNVLIDNLPAHCNPNKMAYIGIDSNQYYQTPEYYGVDYPDDPFFEDVKEFIQERV